MLVERMDFGGGHGVRILAGGGVCLKKKELCYPKASPASVDLRMLFGMALSSLLLFASEMSLQGRMLC